MCQISWAIYPGLDYLAEKQFLFEITDVCLDTDEEIRESQIF